MADDIARNLSDAKVRTARPKDAEYKLADGGGLYLLVKPSGVRLWRYKFRLHGKEGLHALGAYPDLTLAAARDAHRAARAMVAAGTNPVHTRKTERRQAAQALLRARIGAFETVVDDWAALTEPNLAALSIRQRKREISKHLVPAFRGRNVAAIPRVEVAALIKRVEEVTPEVARNLRNYLSGIFEHAIDVGLCDASPVPPVRVMRRRKQVPHPAMAVGRLPAFLGRLGASTSDPATVAAMRLVVLTACRKNEVCGARWSEVDLDAAEWLIPAGRMKARREHWVPLSDQAVAILRQLRRETNGDLVFPNRRDRDRAMADRTLNAWLERNGYTGETCHGFRSVFSTHFNAGRAHPDVIERCLAHAPADPIRGTYNRYEYKDERRAVLQQWADWLDKIQHAPVNV